MEKVYEEINVEDLNKKGAVGLPLAGKFNEMVYMDLKLWKEEGKTIWILHMIDMYLRYTQSVFIKRNRTTDVLVAIMKNWAGVLGL
ncbi:hypothetical protein SK128_005386 [Halocaridina rubra]|uniref:Uncharacterized protein n=1 Tax=Halocaridina rubra TaxID=373956 RepID=A0AAN8WY47_HALRR